LRWLRGMFKLNTIDLDNHETKELILAFIKECPYLITLDVTPSPGGRGWHFTLWCSRSCELCRELYDDPIRYAKDRIRPSYTRNILFFQKYVDHYVPAESLNTTSPTEPTLTKDLNNAPLLKTKDLNTDSKQPNNQRVKKMVRLKIKTTITEVEEGIHEAKLSTVERVETSVGPALRWVFVLADGTEVTGITSMRASPASKLVRWFTALGGKPENGEIDTDKITGRTCQVRIVHRAGKFGGARFANVADVLPLPIKK